MGEFADIKFIDLFCGIGGFRQSLNLFGSTCVFSSDWDKDAQDTYQLNYGERPVGDITQIEADDIPEHQVLCGGFPLPTLQHIGENEWFFRCSWNLTVRNLTNCQNASTRSSVS